MQMLVYIVACMLHFRVAVLHSGRFVDFGLRYLSSYIDTFGDGGL